VFDHTSVGQFLERRFGINVPAISPWHRAVCGDLTSAFNFDSPNEDPFPTLPAIGDPTSLIAAALKLPKPSPPDTPEQLFQEPGMRLARALPYELQVHARARPQGGTLALSFHNSGRAGAVFHVYDRLHLDRIPHRYTVEAGKVVVDEWPLQANQGRYDLWVLGPSGFLREFRGTLPTGTSAHPQIELVYNVAAQTLELHATNLGRDKALLEIRANAYRNDGPWKLLVAHGERPVLSWSLIASHRWYDFTVTGTQFERRFAGRLENGQPGFSDPAVQARENMT